MLVTVMSFSCDDSTDVEKEAFGKVSLMFENVVGETELSLAAEGATDYPYSNSLQQTFNIDLMGYYISKISLIGDGLTYDDIVLVDATSAKGYYHVVAGESGSNMISLEDVPAGSYGQIKFTLGVDGSTVQEGALGGVLNPENGAWFWNWNAGYVAFMIEGSSEVAGSEDHKMRFHVGGWGEPNNVKEIALHLPVAIIVGDETSSMAHIKVDALKAFTGTTDIDFSSTYAVHSPMAGQPIANNLINAFAAHHVMNNQ